MIKGLFVGMSTIDIQLYVNEYPESNTKNKVLSTRVDIGGPAANAAITFAILGGKAKLVTMIGQHEFRSYMLNKLIEKEIDVIDKMDGINRNPNFSTIISSLKNGERTVFANYSSKEELNIGVKIPEDFDICLVDGFLAEIAKKVAKIAKDSGKIMILDGGSWKTGMEDYLKHIDYAVCSSDFYPPGCKAQNEIIDFLRDEGIQNIAITRGERSIIVFEGGRKREIPVRTINTVDSLGAGDVFHGALCYYLIREHNFASALKRASIIATESCKYYGTREWSLKSDMLF